MSETEEMSVLRMMRAKGQLSVEDGAALDAVDRMLRDLSMARTLGRGVAGGCISEEKRQELMAKLSTFSGARRITVGAAQHWIYDALDWASKTRTALTFTPVVVGGEHEPRWRVAVGGVCRHGHTAADAANEVLLRLMCP